MHSSSLICYILLLGLLVNPIFSFVTDRSSSSSSEEITEAPPRRQHVSRIARPGEIVTPTLSELTQFFGATEYDGNRLGGPNFANNEQLTATSNASDKSILSFNDLLTLLAVWHLANEFNSYDVKIEGETEQPSSPAEMRGNEVEK